MSGLHCTQKHSFGTDSGNYLQAASQNQTLSYQKMLVTDSVIPQVYPLPKSETRWSVPTITKMGAYEVTTDLFFSTHVNNQSAFLEFGLTLPIGNLYALLTGKNKAIFVMKGNIRFSGFKQDNFAATLSRFVVDIGKCFVTENQRQYINSNIVGNEGLTVFDCIISGFNKIDLKPEYPLVQIDITYDWLGTLPAFSGDHVKYWTDTVIHFIVDSLLYKQVEEFSDSEYSYLDSESEFSECGGVCSLSD